MEELQSTRGRTEGDTRPTRVDWWLSTTITSTTTLLLVVCLLYSCNTRWREHSTPFLCCPFNESVLCRLLQYNNNSARPHHPLPSQPVRQPSCAPPGAADKPHQVEDEGGRCRRIDTEEEEDKTFCDFNLMRVFSLSSCSSYSYLLCRVIIWSFLLLMLSPSVGGGTVLCLICSPLGRVVMGAAYEDIWGN